MGAHYFSRHWTTETKPSSACLLDLTPYIKIKNHLETKNSQHTAVSKASSNALTIAVYYGLKKGMRKH